MKRLVFIVFVTFLAAIISCSQAQNEKNKKGPIISFKESEHDFGTIEQDGSCVYQFEFQNIGKAPLLIKTVRTSCGCTVPEWSTEPVKKKRSGYVKVKYNSHIVGSFAKSITVYTNANDSVVTLHIKGTVVAKGAAAEKK